MPIEEFQFPFVMEVLATIAWAGSGAIVARARGFDFMGVFFIAVISATGGGLLRDALFLQRTPVMLTSPIYLVVPFLAMIVISLFGRTWERLVWWDKLVNIIDALGMPAFALLGFQLALLNGIPFVGALFVGLINGVAGGILRDVLVDEVPQLFRPGQFYGTLTIFAALFYYLLVWRFAMDSNTAAWAALLVAAALRLLIIRFNWRSQPVKELERELLRAQEELARRYRRGRDQSGDP